VQQPSIEQRIQRRFNKATVNYQLLADGDHVLIALSGGKDSLLLTELMARRQRIHRPCIKVSAVHVRMQNIAYESDTQYLEDFCTERGIKLHVLTASFDATTDTRHTPCVLCSRTRRKRIFQLAKELGCNKIALGHHQDDILHTTLMNLTFEGAFNTMPVRLELEKMPLTLIRPLALCTESDIRAYAETHNYQKQNKQCPYEQQTNRTAIPNLFQQLEQLNPEARYSIWHALEKADKLMELKRISN
jgi:tRNA(Ile)-lysidine synthase TilS/MesJ